MPKQLKELRLFNKGTVSSPAASDIPDEAPVYSKNIEALDEQGKLKGSKKDVPLRSDSSELGLNRYMYWFQNGNAPYLGEDIFFQVTAFGDTITGDTYTNTVGGTAFTRALAQKIALKDLCTKLEAKAYIKKATPLPLIYNDGEVTNTTPSFIVTTDTLTLNIDALQTTIRVTTSNACASMELGKVILLTNGSTTEYVRVTGINAIDGTTDKLLSVERNVEYEAPTDENTYTGTSSSFVVTGTTISAIFDYNSIEVVYHKNLEEISGPRYFHSSALTTSAIQVNLTSYLELNGRNMLLINSRDDNSNFTKTNVVVYNKDVSVDPVEYKIKVVKNFYEESDNDEPVSRQIVEPTTADVFSTNEGYPESVSLARGPNAVYIGNGSTKSSKAQWLGEIQHEQFGQSLEGYFLEEAELKAIDDGQAVYSLTHLDVPHTGTYGSMNRFSPKYLAGINPDGRYFYAMNVENVDGAYGKQYRSEDNLGWIPTALGSSKTFADFMANSSVTHEPFDSGNWNGDNSTTNNGHDANSSYFFTSREGFPDEIRAISLNLTYTTGLTPNVPDKLLHTDFGCFGLKHEIVVDSQLEKYTKLTAGQKISRKPKSGSYISDIMEKGGYLYIQYSHKSGFTFDEEWLYVVNLSDVMALADLTSGVTLASSVVAKPITPPAVQLKNWGNDYMNFGKDWWMPLETFNGNGLKSQSWIGQDGVYGSYSNYCRWRNVDILGFMSNGKHSLYDRQVDLNDNTGFNLTEKDTGSYWNEVFSSYVDFLSDDENMYAWGFTTSDSNQRQDNNPRVSLSDGINGLDIGNTLGYETYSVFPRVGGLTNFNGTEDTDGDIAIALFMDAKQVTTPIRIKKKRKSTQSWFTYKRRHAFYNDTENIIDEIDEMRVLTVSRHSLGVSQRCFPFNTDHRRRSRTYTSNEEEESSYGSTYETITGINAFTSVNGSSDSDWSVSDSAQGKPGYFNDNSITEDGSTRIAPQKYAFRCGTYAAINPSGVESNKWYKQLHNRMSIKLKPATSAQTGQAENDFTCQPPNDSAKLSSISKSYQGGTNFLTTSKTTLMPRTDTFISRWNKTRPSGTSAGRHDWHTTPNYNPMKLKNLGQAVFIDEPLENTTDTRIQLSPTAGLFQTGYAEISSNGHVYNEIDVGNSEYSTRFKDYDDGALTVGLSASFSSPTVAYDDDGEADTDDVHPDAAFMKGVTYYYKMTLLYDGYQEGPLSAYSITAVNTAGPNYEVINVTLDISSPPKRASHICLYRKNAKNDFYRLVDEIDLAGGWAYNEERDLHTKVISDEGKLGATYEAITGISETLFETTVNYKLSTVAQGHLIVADCYHPEIKQGQNFIFKSEPNAFSNFNWAKNYCVLPGKPTAIAWFAGKLYAFDLANMYRVNIDNLVLEDTFEGTGCIGPDGLVITDLGMFFCDYQGMYVHNGDKAENISQDISESSSAGDASAIVETTVTEAWDSHPWQRINHNIPPKALYDAKTLTVWFCFQDKHEDGTIYNGAWKYGLASKRWDLQDTGKALGTFTGNRNDIYISGDNLLIQVDKGSNERKLWSWNSKHLDFGLASQDKTYTSLRIVFNNDAEAILFNAGLHGSISATIDGKDSVLKGQIKKSIVSYTPSEKKGKKLQFKLKNMALEVDSIAIIFKSKNIK